VGHVFSKLFDVGVLVSNHEKEHILSLDRFLTLDFMVEFNLFHLNAHLGGRR